MFSVLLKKVILELHQPIFRHSFLERLLLVKVVKKGINLVVISNRLKKIIQEVNLLIKYFRFSMMPLRNHYKKRSIKNSIGYFEVYY